MEETTTSFLQRYSSQLVGSLLPAAKKLKKLFSFQYDDTPLSDKIYHLHRHWLKIIHDHYFRVEHFGQYEEAKKVAKKEHIMIISHHGNTLEAALIGYFFIIHQLGKLRVLVYKEAFRLPFIREFFRSGQCIPISIEAGSQALKEGHIMVFPEGMDFIKRYVQKNYVIKFHKGFLNIAQKYLQDHQLDHIHIVPVGHDGIENTLKFWVIDNPTIVEKFIKPIFHYPYFVFPKLPLILPHKTVMKWGKPQKVTLEDLQNPRLFTQMMNDFRSQILTLRRMAHKLNELRDLPFRARPEFT